MQTPLHYATTKGNLQAVEMLMNAPGIKIEVIWLHVFCYKKQRM